MKKLIIAAALMGALAAYQASAFSVNVSRIGGYYNYAGGEFDVTSVSSDSLFNSIVANNYVAGTTSINGGLETFCLSITTELLPNPQNATLVGGVSSAIQYLYRQFAAGTLAYDYLDTTPADNSGTSGRAQSAIALQAAIWYLDGASWTQIASKENGWTTANQTAAQAYVDLGNAAPSSDYGVKELYLTSSGNPSQPMLIAVPDGGSTVILLGFALVGCWFVSRKLQRA